MKNLKVLFNYIHDLKPDENYVEGTIITFIEMHTIRRDIQELTSTSYDGFREFLVYLACRGLKPVITEYGFRLMPISCSINMYSIPDYYNFAKSPFIASPLNFTRGFIYPMLDLPLDNYYAHSLRWFPWNKHNIPARFKTMKLSEAGQEKVYIDVPCITTTDSHLQFIRVSQLVFEKLYFTAHKKESFVSCSRKQGTSTPYTDIILEDKCDQTILDSAEILYKTSYKEFQEKVERFLRVQPEHGITSRAVADFIIHL